MKTLLFTGERVRLAAADPEKDAAPWAAWMRDAEFLRLLDTDPAIPESAAQRRRDIEDRGAPKDSGYPFVIRTLADDQLIGFIGLWIGPAWSHRNGWVGLGLGERACWGRGYGTDALRVVLRFAFTELNLHRVSLGVFEYNPRALKAYTKAGFVVEGRTRQDTRRAGGRWDSLWMGILRRDWEAGQA